ncbi:hypothetical protein KR50_34930 [Jeotgalibacillus campisalis]|uniref:Uncharacterized protein n=1 Tax=Jeotgalibacillus campisalis TaxID=220754 RepID=A0A0C2QYI3_9BACL|nr:hypothetical protein KR50_34930 [Jeotgalibacillus campisalis]
MNINIRKFILFFSGVLGIFLFFVIQNYIKNEPVDWWNNLVGGFIIISFTLLISWLWNGTTKGS